MTPTEKYLTPYGLYKEQSFEQYCARLPELFFKNEVPEDVRRNFEVIEQLLAHSYFEYRFIDEAYSKALHTFEMAMNIRYQQLTNTSKFLRFPRLIHKLVKLNQFDAHHQLLERLKWMRDHYSHPQRHHFAGITLWSKIQTVIFLINQLYEDVELRMTRRKLEADFMVTLEKQKLNRHSVLVEKETAILLYQFQLLFIDNKESIPNYYLAFTPLFDLTSKTESDIKCPMTYLIVVTQPQMTENILTVTNLHTQNPLHCSSYKSDPLFEKKFSPWLLEFQNKKQKWMYDQSVHSNNSELYFEEFWKFLKK